MSCIALLPLQCDSLLYGSADGGTTVRTHDSIAADVEAQATELFNLAPHATQDGKQVFLAADVEIHRLARPKVQFNSLIDDRPSGESEDAADEKTAPDSRHDRKSDAADARLTQLASCPELYFYLDTARLLPPEYPALTPNATPKPSTANSIFYEALRVEFVRAYREPLCADALSGFLRHETNRKTLDKAVQMATDHLFKVTIYLMIKLVKSLSNTFQSYYYLHLCFILIAISDFIRLLFRNVPRIWMQ